MNQRIPDPIDMEKALKSLWRMGGLINTLSIGFEVDGDAITTTMPIEQTHTGAPGVAHGGSIMALMDTALGAHAFTHAASRGLATSTVEMKVNLLKPARIGQRLSTTTTLESSGKSLLVITGRAVDADTGVDVAFAVGTFNLYAIEGYIDALRAFSETDEDTHV